MYYLIKLFISRNLSLILFLSNFILKKFTISFLTGQSQTTFFDRVSYVLYSQSI